MARWTAFHDCRRARAQSRRLCRLAQGGPQIWLRRNAEKSEAQARLLAWAGCPPGPWEGKRAQLRYRLHSQLLLLLQAAPSAMALYRAALYRAALYRAGRIEVQ